MDLHIIDVSNYISAGSEYITHTNGETYLDENGKFRGKVMPVGGVGFLLGVIDTFMFNSIYPCDFAFCFDSAPKIKRDMFKELFPVGEGYKETRSRKPTHIPFNRDLAYQVIQQCGFNAFKVEGYEADDIIATLVKMYHEQYERIYIHTRDGDLAYLVDEKVSIATVGDKGKEINRSNWSYTVDKNQILPYGSATINKLMLGDSGDNIPPIQVEVTRKIQRVMDDDLYEMCADVDMTREVIRRISDNDDYTMRLLDIIIPLKVPEHELTMYSVEFDVNAYNAYSVLCGRRGAKGTHYNSTDKIEDTMNNVLERYIDKRLK